MISKYDKIIFVTGGTGKQGGAVVHHLLKNGWRVRTMTRNASKPAAKALVDKGVEVIQGSLDDTGAVARALTDVYGVYSVQSFEDGVEAEIRQGMLLADLAKEAAVGHFVYSSVAAADKNTGIVFFDSKWQIEQHIRRISLPYTIFRPVFFMENFLMPQIRSSIINGLLTLPIKPEKRLQMIAVDDIGAFVAQAFESPDQWLCCTNEIAGDEITMCRAAQLFSKAIGREVRYSQMPIEEMRRVSEDYARMYEWFNDNNFSADITKLRSFNADLMNFEMWLNRSNWQQYAIAEAVWGRKI